ncbi:MAG: cytochrome c maturation protein CcmE [Phyllobacteriaceae bacterium]|nr:cytochrome c maturation protein CcmE [Phyllobacteriaceae bacterium]
MTRKQKRLTVIGLAGLVLAAAVGLVLFALNDEITFFTSPSDLATGHAKPGSRLRLGGLVEAGSVGRDNATVHFRVTDGANSVAVTYTGILPDLFREGQGTVAEGRLGPDGVFVADSVLAKHDEKYMPKEVADALKKSGHWQETSGQGTAKTN